MIQIEESDADTLVLEGQCKKGRSVTEKQRIRIVVAEDDPRVLETVSMMLKVSGYDVVTAADGFEALLHFQDQVPDLILSDLNMPAMSGFELLSVIRAGSRRSSLLPQVELIPRVLFPKG